MKHYWIVRYHGDGYEMEMPTKFPTLMQFILKWRFDMNYEHPNRSTHTMSLRDGAREDAERIGKSDELKAKLRVREIRKRANRRRNIAKRISS